MPSVNLSFVEATRANVRSQLSSILKGEVKTGKEIVRESLGRMSDRTEERHDNIRANFVENEGKGVKVDVTA